MIGAPSSVRAPMIVARVSSPFLTALSAAHSVEDIGSGSVPLGVFAGAPGLPESPGAAKKEIRTAQSSRIPSAWSLYASITYGRPETFAASSERAKTSFRETVLSEKFLLPAISCCSPVLKRWA